MRGFAAVLDAHDMEKLRAVFAAADDETIAAVLHDETIAGDVVSAALMLLEVCGDDSVNQEELASLLQQEETGGGAHQADLQVALALQEELDREARDESAAARSAVTPTMSSPQGMLSLGALPSKANALMARLTRRRLRTGERLLDEGGGASDEPADNEFADLDMFGATERQGTYAAPSPTLPPQPSPDEEASSHESRYRARVNRARASNTSRASHPPATHAASQAPAILT